MYVNGVIKSFPSQVSGFRKQANSYSERHKRLAVLVRREASFLFALRQREVSFFDLDKERPLFLDDSAEMIKPS